MSTLRWLDLIVIGLYMAGMALVGWRFARRQTSTERYFVAQRSIPGWAMGLSLFATLISSVTFIAYPGSAYAGNWNELVPGLMVIPVLFLVVWIIIPFYRRVVGLSAYEYFGKRFGYSTRAFSSLAFAMGHFSKLAFVFYLVALTVQSIAGWNIYWVTVVMGIVTVFYTYLGGLEAVIWTDVIQGMISIVGIFICLIFLLFLPAGGPSAVFQTAWDSHKLSLGALDFDLTRKGFWVMTLYGIFWYLQKYTADQTVVQRYLVTKDDRQATRGTVLGAMLCVPVWTLFMLIGTLLWSFYKLTGEHFPSHIAKADQIFPYFLSTHIPPGLAGLFMASLFAAAMSTISSDLNCLSVIGVEDFYRRLKPNAADHQRLHVGKILVVVAGVLTTLIALVLARYTEHALSLYFTFTAILSGGLFGLFFLAFFSTRANTRGIWAGIIASVLFTAYATLTQGKEQLLNLGRLNFHMPGVMIGVVGHLVLIVVGYVASLLLQTDRAASELTLWGWLKRKNAAPGMQPVANSIRFNENGGER
ncbi:MAG TPA: sodium:solute symporter [Verrucomicrobiae bacterium]|nr:sodium:solute symporter [Verrucomicrobiae bacterium]